MIEAAFIAYRLVAYRFVPIPVVCRLRFYVYFFFEVLSMFVNPNRACMLYVVVESNDLNANLNVCLSLLVCSIDWCSIPVL